MSKYTYQWDNEFIYDSGDMRWEGYHLDAYGNNLNELCDNAAISVTDQDGDEIRNYGIDDFNDKEMKILENATGEKYEDTEHYRMWNDAQALKRIKNEAFVEAQKIIPCTVCNKQRGEDWGRFGNKCKECHIESLKNCYSCGQPNSYYNSDLQYCISTTCPECTKKFNEIPSQCDVCGEVKTYATAYFLKLPDCGPGGNDVEEFCCKECSEDHSRYFNRGKNKRKTS